MRFCGVVARIQVQRLSGNREGVLSTDDFGVLRQLPEDRCF